MVILLEHQVRCYILAVALQMSGAIILILYFCGRTKDRILREYFPGSNTVQRDKDNEVTLEKEKIQKCAVKIYVNRLAFAYIALGYLLGVYGNVELYRADRVSIAIIASAFVLVIMGVLFAKIFAAIIYKKDWIMNYDEISHIADTFATKEEIDKMFED